MESPRGISPEWGRYCCLFRYTRVSWRYLRKGRRIENTNYQAEEVDRVYRRAVFPSAQGRSEICASHRVANMRPFERGGRAMRPGILGLGPAEAADSRER